MTTDKINHPEHYLTHRSGIECIQITEHMSFCLGNAIKYIWRADSKGDAINDLSKAIWYLEREITRRTDEANTAPMVAKSSSSADARHQAFIVESTRMARENDAGRQYEMGNMAYTGEGMPQDLDHAREWWRLAAAQGHSSAQIALDICASASDIDDPDASITDIRMQAVGGDRQAQLYLAQGYAHGWYGLIRSSYMSCLWRNRANELRTEEADVVTVSDPLAEMRARAEAGDRHAQRTLGDAYATGMEVSQDRVESDRWYELANEPRTEEDAQ